MGIRWARLIGDGKGSPLSCEDCSARDRESRNCANWKGLSEEARVVQKYTVAVQDEHSIAGASKAFRPLGDIRMYECPLSYVSTDTVQVLNLIATIEHTGTLLYAGGIADQPYWLMQAITIAKEEEVLAQKAKGK